MNKKVYSIVLNNFTHDNRVLKENLTLKKNGFNLIIVALHENGLPEKERVEDLPVHRIKLVSKNWSKHPIIQIFKYIEFVIRVLFLYHDADIYHCNDLNALPIGVLVKIFFNQKAIIVYDAHEYEIERDGMNKLSRAFCHLLEGILIKTADKVITVSKSIAIEYSKLYNIRLPYLVLNCPNYIQVKRHDLFRQELGIREDQKIFLYQGGLSKARGLDKLLTYFSNQSNDEKVIVFMGYGPMEQEIKNCNSKNVFFHKAVNQDVLLNYTSSADCGIFVYDNLCKSFYYCLPNKLFEYLHAGLPVIVSNLYELGNFVRDNKIGIVTNSTSLSDINAAISDFDKLDLNELKTNARNIAKTHCWAEQEKILLEVYGF